MKVRKQYALYVSPLTGEAFYGGKDFSKRINQATLGTIYDCTLTQLKNNLELLKQRGYNIQQRRY